MIRFSTPILRIHSIFRNPFHQTIPVSTLAHGGKIRLGANDTLRIVPNRERSNVASAHESHTDCFDTMVDVFMDYGVIDVEGMRADLVRI